MFVISEKEDAAYVATNTIKGGVAFVSDSLVKEVWLL